MPATTETSGTREVKTDEVGFEIRTFEADEIRVKENDSGPVIFGYAAVFDRWSEDLGGFRERIAPGAFAEALKEDDVRFTLNHDPNFVLGRNRAGNLLLREDKRGLYFENTPPDTQWARDLLTSLRRGDITGASIRFQIPKGGEEWDGDERTIMRVKPLRDITLATYPAYPDTEAQVRSDESRETEARFPVREFYGETLRAGGIWEGST